MSRRLYSQRAKFVDRLFAELDAVEEQVIEGDLLFREEVSSWLDSLDGFIHEWQTRKSNLALSSLSAIDAVNDFIAAHPPDTRATKTAAARLKRLLKG